MKLNQYTRLPEGFFDAHSTDLYTLFGAPSLIHIQGRRDPALFVSVLLHGNETSGFYAIKEILQKYQNQSLPRSLSLFIGNVKAAQSKQRRLDDQVDFNRVWPHHDLQHDCEEAVLLQQVVDEMKRRGVFLSVDLHNNTGINPHYACINKLEMPFFQLATIFSRNVIYFTEPKGVQSQAFCDICPSVTLECGKTEHRRGITHAKEFLEYCLNLSHLPDHPISEHDIDLFHTMAIVRVPEALRFGFAQHGDDVMNDVDMLFAPQLELMNFSELAVGTEFAYLNEQNDISKYNQAQIDQVPLDIRNEYGAQLFSRYFKIDNNRLITACPLMPSMLTIDADVIRKDCLCYLMERLTIDEYT